VVIFYSFCEKKQTENEKNNSPEAADQMADDNNNHNDLKNGNKKIN
jgi:hypothetical protein